MHNECRCSLIHDMTYLWTCIRVSWVDQRHYSPITIIGCWCGLVVVHAFPLAKSQDEQAMSWACCSQASWGVCSATRHWCSSQIACPYFQCHSSKGFHHRYLDPLVGHRDNHTELGLKWSAFAKGIIIPFKWHVPTGHAIWVRGLIIHIRMLWTENRAELRPAIVSFYEKRATDKEKHVVVLEPSLHAASLDGVNQSQALVP